MKITRISVEFMVDENTAVEEFMARLLSTATPVTIEHTPLPLSHAAAPSVSEHTAPPTDASPTTGTEGASRRRRTANPTANSGTATTQADAGAPSEATSAGSTDTGSRRRRAAPPAASPDPMPINDAEMTKAASNTAEVLTNMGIDGVGMVKLILEDFKVSSVGEVPADQRPKFLDECKLEITRAKEDQEAAP